MHHDLIRVINSYREVKFPVSGQESPIASKVIRQCNEGPEYVPLLTPQ
jgi:hypothetical protein